MTKKMLFRAGCFLLGLVLNSLGIWLIVLANLGTHPVDAIAIGIFRYAGVTIGTWLNCISVLMVLAAALILRSKPKLLCILVSLAFGVFFDGWGWLLFNGLSQMQLGIAVRAAAFFGGIAINVAGVSVYLCTRFPVSALDNLMLSIKEKTGWTLEKSRICMEMVLSAVGLALRGPVGAGTLILVVGFSMLLERVYRLVQPRYNALERRLGL